MAYWDKSDDDHMKAYFQAVVKDNLLDCCYFNMSVGCSWYFVTFFEKASKIGFHRIWQPFGHGRNWIAETEVFQNVKPRYQNQLADNLVPQKLPTLESGIEVGPTVINLAFFSRPYGLIRDYIKVI